jgi:hypothetical protein
MRLWTTYKRLILEKAANAPTRPYRRAYRTRRNYGRAK